MRNPDAWLPSKLIPRRDGSWGPNPGYMQPGSRFYGEVAAGPTVAAIRRTAHGRLLDAGCGDVPYFGIYRDLVSSVTCVDWPGSSHGTLHVDRWVDLSGPLPFAQAEFDTVLLTDVLEHIARPVALLGEVRRVLAPGGAVVVSVPFLYWIHEAPHDYFRYTEHGLRAMCEDAGLAVRELNPYGGYPDVALDLVSKLAVRRAWMARIFSGTAGRAAKSRPYRRLRQRTERVFPLGYILIANKT